MNVLIYGNFNLIVRWSISCIELVELDGWERTALYETCMLFGV